MNRRKKGSQLTETAAILLLAIIFFSAFYAIDKKAIDLQAGSSEDIFQKIRNLWETSSDPQRQIPNLLQEGRPRDGQRESKAREGNQTDLRRILVALVGDFGDQEFRGIAFEEASRTFFTILPETVIGLVHDVEYWKDWARWQSGGPYQGDDEITRVLIVAGDYTHGIELAVADYLTFGGVSAVVTYIETKDLGLSLSQTFPAQYIQLLAIAVDGKRDKATRAKALGIAIGIAAFIIFVHEFGGPIKEAIGEAFSEAWPKVKSIIGRMADRAPEAAKAIFRELGALAIAAKERLGAAGGEELAERSAELAEELVDVDDDPEAIAASLRTIMEWTDGGDPEELVAFLKETAERSEGLFARKQIRKNFYDVVSKIAEEEGVERAAQVRSEIERIILLSEEKAGEQWYTGLLEDIADEVKADVDEAERTIEIVRQALERDDAAPGRIVKTQDRVRLDIPDAILKELFDLDDIEQGDLVLVEYERFGTRFRTIAKYGEGGIKGFHALLDEGAEPYKGDYGIATVRKLTDDGFMAFWQERSQCQKIMVEKIGGEWYASIDGKVFEIEFKGLGDAGGYIYEDTEIGGYNIRYYKDGKVAIGIETGAEKPTFRTIIDAKYDEKWADLVLKLQGREEPFHIYFYDIVNEYRWKSAQPSTFEIYCKGITYSVKEVADIDILDQDDLILLNADPNDPKVRVEIGQLGERLGRAKVMKIDGGEVLDAQVNIPKSRDRADALVQIGDKEVLYEFKATTEEKYIIDKIEEGIRELLYYMERKTDVDEGRVTVFYLQKDGQVIRYEVTVPKG